MHFSISRFSRCFALGAILLGNGWLMAGNWPEWRGPHQNGTTTDTGFPLRWDRETHIRWRIDLPDRGNSSPIVWDDKVFLTQAVSADGRRELICVDRGSGDILWRKGTVYQQEDSTHRDNPHAAASPVTDGQVVVAYFGSAGVFCFDMDGNELWSRDLGKQEHEWGYSSSPIIQGDRVFLYHGPGTPSEFYALNRDTGETIWKRSFPEPVPTERVDGFAGNEPGYVGAFCTPVFANGNILFSLPGRLLALHPETGETVWSADGLNPLVYTSPTVVGNLAIGIGGYFGGSMAVRTGGEGDVTETRRIWHEERSRKSRLGSPAVSGNYMYLVNMDGIAECIEIDTGKQIWEERLRGNAAQSASWSSPVLAEGHLYFVNRSGETIVIKASPEFEIVAVNEIGEPSHSSLAASDGEFFLRTWEGLWCIGDGA